MQEIKACHLGWVLNSEVKFNYKSLHKFKAFVLLCKLYVKIKTSVKYALAIPQSQGLLFIEAPSCSRPVAQSETEEDGQSG